MNFRTDLAIERKEYKEKEKLDGVISCCEERDGIKITRIEIIDERGERLLSKPCGRYITIEAPPFIRDAGLFSSAMTVFSDELKSLLPEKGSVLVAGLGNEDITADALGPKCLNLLLATRHISRELRESLGLGELRSVAGIVPGVLGKTGIETSEIIFGVVRRIKPSCVIAVDALAARKTQRLGTTIQMADTGISPGSGVGNSRSRIGRETLGVPVIAVGVPTVVDAVTMTADILEQSGAGEGDFSEKLKSQEGMLVTPKEIDAIIDRAARLIALGINTALQPELSAGEILSIVS
ncbi:MAG: GPR endopeptidase [Acutalibacteraceae bacterium]